MRTNNLSQKLSLLVLTLMLMAPAVKADSFTGRVVDIADGDTLSLQVERRHYRIRIAAIDAPERFQAWGDKSKTNLSRLAINQIAVAHCSKVERGDQQVCSVKVNGLDIGLQQIKDGMAWWDRQNAGSLTAKAHSDYAHAELMAKLRRMGLWTESNPVPPWEFKGNN